MITKVIVGHFSLLFSFTRVNKSQNKIMNPMIGAFSVTSVKTKNDNKLSKINIGLTIPTRILILPNIKIGMLAVANPIKK